jgi:hypothetical protein
LPIAENPDMRQVGLGITFGKNQDFNRAQIFLHSVTHHHPYPLAHHAIDVLLEQYDAWTPCRAAI